MKIQRRLAHLFGEIVKEAKANPSFAARIEAVFGGLPKRESGSGVARPSRRAPAAIDPFDEFEKGEDNLRSRLSGLSIDQLRDVLAQYGMDRAKLAMKWKDRARIMDLIVKSVAGRAAKGDAFRGERRFANDAKANTIE